MADTAQPDGRPARRRSGLLQERSRQTRQRLVRAALDLWSARGFETGIEDTTVEEIVQAAGVTKGTFYFHFARKEEILLEMGWDTASAANNEARKCLDAGRPLDESLSRVIDVLARQVGAAPPAAVARAANEFYRAPTGEPITGEHPSFSQGFAELFRRAREQGDVTDTIDPEEMAQMMEVLVMDAIFEWAAGRSSLGPTLHKRAAILVAGLRPGPVPRSEAAK